MARPYGVILALDLSTRVGWACGEDHGKLRHGLWALPDGSLGKRCSALANSLEDALGLFRPDLVILEAPLPPQAQTAMNSARIQFGLAAVAEMICEEHGIPVEEERADAVRKLIMGSARQSKDQILEWARAQGWSPYDHNVADALALWRYRHVLGREVLRK